MATDIKDKIEGIKKYTNVIVQEHGAKIKQYVFDFVSKVDNGVTEMMSSIEKYIIEHTEINDVTKEQIITKMHDEVDIFRNKLEN